MGQSNAACESEEWRHHCVHITPELHDSTGGLKNRRTQIRRNNFPPATPESRTVFNSCLRDGDGPPNRLARIPPLSRGAHLNNLRVTMPRLPLIDIFVLLAYLGGTLGIGLWAARNNRTTDQFMAAGRKIPGWAVGLSIFGTYVSSISFLALPSKAYSSNWNVFVFSISLPLTTWVAVKYFVPFYRRSTALSAY